MPLKVSVIIPVFNAEKFVHKAINSALAQPETGEIILVEDGSTDNSYEVCLSFYNENPDIIKLISHEKRANLGAPASFNAGILASQFEYVNILGADDYFLPLRFKYAIPFLENNPEFDATSESIGTIYYDNDSKNRFIKSKNIKSESDADNFITGFDENISTPNLLNSILKGQAGFGSLNGMVIKKSLFKRIGLFNINQKISQDTEFLFRLLIKGKLKVLPKNRIIGMRGVHLQNRWNKSNQEQVYYRAMYYRSIFQIMNFEDLEKKVLARFLRFYLRSHYEEYFLTHSKLKKAWYLMKSMLFLAFKHPNLLIKAYLN